MVAPYDPPQRPREVTDDGTAGAAARDGSGVRGRRNLTPGQVRSIRAVMRLFVEDDLARGVPLDRRRYCPCCDGARPAAGFVRYEGLALCNACAVRYEIARARGVVKDVGTFALCAAAEVAGPGHAAAG